MTPKEQGALNTLITEKRNQIEELELSITENKMKIKTYRENIRKLEKDGILKGKCKMEDLKWKDC